jgi:C4-type Zn-finger protein
VRARMKLLYDRGRYREKSMAAKECPMCGETMQLHERQLTERVPGTPQTSTARFHEWVCPECDYFEEVEDDGS